MIGDPEMARIESGLSGDKLEYTMNLISHLDLHEDCKLNTDGGFDGLNWASHRLGRRHDTYRLNRGSYDFNKECSLDWIIK